MKKNLPIYIISGLLTAVSAFFFVAGCILLKSNLDNTPDGEPAPLVEVFEIGVGTLSVEERDEILASLGIDVAKFLNLNMDDGGLSFFRKDMPKNIIKIELFFEQITKLTIHLNDNATNSFSEKSMPYSRKEFGEFVLGVYEYEHNESTTIRYKEKSSNHTFYIDCLFGYDSEPTQDFLTRFFSA